MSTTPTTTTTTATTAPSTEAEPLSAYTCPICFSPPTNATLTPCGHVCCGQCLFTAVKSTIRRNMLTAMDRAPVPSAGLVLSFVVVSMAVQSKPVLTPFAAAFAGALGACFSNAVVYPLDVAKTRIQATAKGKRTMLAVLLDIYHHQGVSGWYRGFPATMLNTFSMQYAYFFFYAFLRTSYTKRLAARAPPGAKPPILSTAAELALGAAAGALSQIFTIPVSVIATRQQVGRASRASTSTGSDNDDDDSFLTVAREIIREDGIAGLWLGIQPGMVLTVNPAITYGVYERLKSVLARGDITTLTPAMSFLLGAFSKSLATVVTYPYIMAKVRIQARSSTRDPESDSNPDPDVLPHVVRPPPPKSTGAIALLVRVLRTEGIVGWYQGMSAQIIKAVLSQALLFVSKDQFERWAIVLMVLLAEMRQRLRPRLRTP